MQRGWAVGAPAFSWMSQNCSGHKGVLASNVGLTTEHVANMLDRVTRREGHKVPDVGDDCPVLSGPPSNVAIYAWALLIFGLGHAFGLRPRPGQFRT